MSETENRAVARLAPRARTREMLSPAALVEAFSRRTPFSFSFEKFSAPSGDDANTADEVHSIFSEDRKQRALACLACNFLH